eukprot:COSAG06_NODE_1453_length_9426_cov_16.624209_6_plen_37_part_00
MAGGKLSIAPVRVSHTAMMMDYLNLYTLTSDIGMPM